MNGYKNQTRHRIAVYNKFPSLSHTELTDTGEVAGRPYRKTSRPDILPLAHWVNQWAAGIVNEQTNRIVEMENLPVARWLRPSNLKCVSTVIRYKIVVNIFHYSRSRGGSAGQGEIRIQLFATVSLKGRGDSLGRGFEGQEGKEIGGGGDRGG